jgi:hypothetical protein
MVLTATSLVGIVGYIVCFEDQSAFGRSLLEIEGAGFDDQVFPWDRKGDGVFGEDEGFVFHHLSRFILI